MRGAVEGRRRQDGRVGTSDLNADRWRRYGRDLALLLWAAWDPIGGPPPDGHYEYAAPVWQLLARDASTEELAAGLAHFRTEHMGLQPDPKVDERAALTLQL